MSHNMQAILTILGMALVTYIPRAIGPAVANRLPSSGATHAFLKALPGAILIAIVAPYLANNGPKEAAAGVVVVIATLVSRSLGVAMIAGVGALWAMRTFI